MQDPTSELIEQARAATGVALSSSSAGRLLAFERLLAERGSELGVISSADVDRLRDRHMLDSLRAARQVSPGDRLAYDLGSGGGLPGVVVAVAVPDLEVVLVEARRSRVAFLELAIDELGLTNASAIHTRIEELPEGLGVDLCFARALAAPSRSWQLAAPILSPGGRLIYFAGKGFESEPASTGPEGERSPDPSDGLVLATVPQVGLASGGPLVIMGRP